VTQALAHAPRPGEVRNLGGGRGKSGFMLGAMVLIEQAGVERANFLCYNQKCVDDHIFYISELNKLLAHCPEREVQIELENMLAEMVRAEEHYQ